MNDLTPSPRTRLLSLYEDLRVADVRDGLDTLGYHYTASMQPSVRPVWRTRAFGIARTARYLPFRSTVPALKPEEYMQWSGWYYNNVCTYPWVQDIQPGDFIVIDVSGVDVGLMGSANTLDCVARGARGFVTNGGGVRDTDEIILQQVPFWSVYVSQSMVQGRLQFDSKDVPVSVGGVQVRPGDMIVADGDGVIVVPSEIAEEVAYHAHAEHERDKKDRASYYDQLGRAADETVK
jgi:4-hydroxy-4-methyl-2-oxoglutarate aldolase